MPSLWETMLWRWLGRPGAAAFGEQVELPDLPAATSGTGPGFIVRRASPAVNGGAKPPEAAKLSDPATALDPSIGDRDPELSGASRRPHGTPRCCNCG
jgi:hypothetical protein